MKLTELKKSDLSKSGIYKLSIGGHLYIGSSKNLYNRLTEHYNDLMNKNHYNNFLQKSVNKYGIENLDCDIIEFCNPDIRFVREKYWIDTLNSDMNLQDPVTMKPKSKSTIEKISISTKKAYEEGRIKKKFDIHPIEVYDYLGNFVTTFNNKEDASFYLEIPIHMIQNAASGYKKGNTIYGYRFRYSDSKVPVQKFEPNPRYLGRYYDFYYIDENGEKKFAFDSVKNVYNFLSEQILKNKSKITIFPRLRKYREEWKVLEKDNHIPSNSEMN